MRRKTKEQMGIRNFISMNNALWAQRTRSSCKSQFFKFPVFHFKPKTVIPSTIGSMRRNDPTNRTSQKWLGVVISDPE